MIGSRLGPIQSPRSLVRRKILVSILGVVAILACSGSAQAANLVIGNPVLPTAFKRAYGCPKVESEPCLFVNIAVPTSTGVARSPVNGAVVAWSLGDASSGTYELEVERTIGETLLYDGSYGLDMVGGGTSGPVEVSEDSRTFESIIPIQSGDYIGLRAPAGAAVAEGLESPGFLHGYLGPLSPNGSRLTGQFAGELPFNAEIQPAPTVSGLSTGAGPSAGGTEVQIAGTDLRGVTDVRFGSQAAASFSSGAGETLRAVAPAEPPGRVHVSVETIAGPSEPDPAGIFEYLAPATNPSSSADAPSPAASPRSCVVPRLVGLSVRAARGHARKDECVITRVKRLGHIAAAGARVLRQSPRPRSHRSAGTGITVFVK